MKRILIYWIVAAISFFVGYVFADVVFDGEATEDRVDVHEMIEFNNEMDRRETGKCPTCPDCWNSRF